MPILLNLQILFSILFCKFRIVFLVLLGIAFLKAFGESNSYLIAQSPAIDLNQTVESDEPDSSNNTINESEDLSTVPILDSLESAEFSENEKKTADTDRHSSFSRSFRYIVSSDLGFLVGVNGNGLHSLASSYLSKISPYGQLGNILRYGFSGTLNIGLSKLLGKQKFNSQPTNGQLQNQHKWSFGFQLRNMFSFGINSLTYFEIDHSVSNLYNQEDLRIFYAFQPTLTSAYMFTPLWEMKFYLGPSININFYHEFVEELFLVGLPSDSSKKIETEDSESMDVFSLGVSFGVSLARYFSEFLSLGISTHFVLNNSPQRGKNAGKYYLGQVTLALYLQLSL